MAIYFVCNLDEQGRIAKRREIEAPSDAEAIAAGRATTTKTDESAHGFEVWLGNRMIFSSHGA